MFELAHGSGKWMGGKGQGVIIDPAEKEKKPNDDHKKGFQLIKRNPLSSVFLFCGKNK